MLRTVYACALPPCSIFSWDTEVVSKSRESYLQELWLRFPLKLAAKLFGPNFIGGKKAPWQQQADNIRISQDLQ